MTERPHKLGDFKGWVTLRLNFRSNFAPIYPAVAYQLELGTTEQHDNTTVTM